MLERRRHNIFKLKIGHGEPKADIAHVATIKRALGERASVRVDVNQAWSEAVAARTIAGARGRRLRSGRTADRGGESRRHGSAGRPPPASPSWPTRRCTDPRPPLISPPMPPPTSFAVKIMQSGGLHAAGRVAAIADAAGIGLYGGTMLEGPVGTIAAAHLFASLPHLEWGTELFGPLLLSEEILTQPLDYSDFSLTVPTGPGLGIVLAEDHLDRFRRDRTERSVHTVNKRMA